jgi:hypothetical protein
MSDRRMGPRSPSGSPAKGLRSSWCMARCATTPGSTREFEDVAAVVDAVADRTESRRVGLTDRGSSRGSPRDPRSDGLRDPPAVREATDRAARPSQAPRFRSSKAMGTSLFRRTLRWSLPSLGSSSRPKRCSRGEEAKRRAHSSASGMQAPTPSPEGHSTSSDAVAPAAKARRAGRFQPWVGGARRYFR